ncbi:Luciferin 4-monooxygenase [Pseudolycoriella hygida]|uniref:Luciferin 4-monooxygenase n=1 Tax=Pseudolycoriella hygida TaxID=35572 RepID=A0A9Q0NHB9_9DIPT|nr:Luciferin 4-monooxygenase [Pseudolycoriella hygida]
MVAGIEPGDVVSVISENRFEFAYILFGTIFVNCTCAPINSTYNERELTHALNLSKPKFIFCSNLTVDKVVNVANSLDFMKRLFLIGSEPTKTWQGLTLWKDFTDSKLIENIVFCPQPTNKSKSICLILCSSGTTGLPKGVQLSQQNLIVAIRNRHLLLSKTVDHDIILGLLPLFHVYGCEVLISVMTTATGLIILLPKFEEKTFLHCIEKYRCTTLCLVPPLLVFLAKNANVDQYDLSSVRIIYSGAAPLSKETEEAVLNRLKNSNLMIKNTYGMSELTSGVLSQKNIKKPGSVGELNLGVYAKVIDENGNSLGPNQRGELCFKGSRVMAGYIGDQQATSALIDKDGWLHTGDIGYYDEDLQFYIVDRIKELIKWKGFQVPPAELEAILLTHPKIKDCGVIGKPDEDVGEVPLAFVVKLDNSLSEKEVIEYIVIVSVPQYFEDLGKLLDRTPKRTIANYMMWRVTAFSSYFLTEELRKRQLEYSTALSGKTEQEPRWKECTDIVSGRTDSNEFDDEQSLGHLIIKKLTEAGDQIMMIDGLTDEKLSANELVTRSIKVSKALMVAGIEPGDVVSVISENRFEFAYILFGTIFVNCTCAPINSTYNERELTHALNLSKPKFIFCSNLTVDKVVNVANSLDFMKRLFLIGSEPTKTWQGLTLWKDFTDSKLIENIVFCPQPTNKSKSICLILCSSGTTGLPKGVQLSQQNLIVAIRNRHLLLSKTVDHDIILGLLPLFHVYGCEVLISVMTTATGLIILLPKFEEKTFLHCIEKYRCTTLCLVPPLLVFLAKNANVDQYDLSSVRIIYSGAAPLSKETEEAVLNRLKNSNLMIKNTYGMSELTSGVLSQKNIKKPGSVGELNLGVYAKVIDENGNSLGPNQRGELCFKGSRVMAGYIGDQQATSALIDKDGWLHTGDIGYYDEDLQFYIVDRIKELIKWKGFQVPPAELEAILLTHPKIKDCGVIGKPDEDVGEVPLAFVVKLDNSLSEKEVIEYVNKDASPAKKLRGGVIFVDEIPKNPSGKILRRQLRELIAHSQLKSKL